MQGDPNWSPDGHTIVFATGLYQSKESSLQILDLASHPDAKPKVNIQGIEEVVADMGYHSGAVLERVTGVRAEAKAKSSGLILNLECVAGLRYKLRVIWKVANDKQWESAERKVGYLKDGHPPLLSPASREHKPKLAVQRWKGMYVAGAECSSSQNLQNPICDSPYFIRKGKKQQYCSPACSAEGQSVGGPSQHP